MDACELHFKDDPTMRKDVLWFGLAIATVCSWLAVVPGRCGAG